MPKKHDKEPKKKKHPLIEIEKLTFLTFKFICYILHEKYYIINPLYIYIYSIRFFFFNFKIQGKKKSNFAQRGDWFGPFGSAIVFKDFWAQKFYWLARVFCPCLMRAEIRFWFFEAYS